MTPPSLAEAQKLAEAHKHNFKATLGRETEMRAGSARRMSWAYPAAAAFYILDTDASNDSIGTVLSQIQWGEERVISYASSHLTPTQQRPAV